MQKESPDIIIASGPVIIEDGKVLLNRHGDNQAAQKIWKFPGGTVELDEADSNSDNLLESECRREAKEEMGIEIDIIRPLKPMLIRHPTKPDSFVILIHYLATRIGEVKPDADIIEWNWFDTANLPNDCAPNIRPVIENYLESLKS